MQKADLQNRKTGFLQIDISIYYSGMSHVTQILFLFRIYT